MTPDCQPLTDTGATELCTPADVPKVSVAPGPPQTARNLTRSSDSCVLGSLEQEVLAESVWVKEGIGGLLRHGHFSYGLYLDVFSKSDRIIASWCMRNCVKMCEALWECGREIGIHDSTHFQRLRSIDEFLRPHPRCCRRHVQSCACQRPATRVWKAGLHDWSFWETRNSDTVLIP